MSQVKGTLNNLQEAGYRPTENISEILTDERLFQFEPQLGSFGYDMHLITLPEFHVVAYNMHVLSEDFDKNGILAYVKNVQRPERIRYENNDAYTYYKHQTATGTGLEAQFSSYVGSSDTNVLDDSTETDDTKLRNK